MSPVNPHQHPQYIRKIHSCEMQLSYSVCPLNIVCSTQGRDLVLHSGPSRVECTQLTQRVTTPFPCKRRLLAMWHAYTHMPILHTSRHKHSCESPPRKVRYSMQTYYRYYAKSQLRSPQLPSPRLPSPAQPSTQDPRSKGTTEATNTYPLVVILFHRLRNCESDC